MVACFGRSQKYLAGLMRRLDAGKGSAAIRSRGRFAQALSPLERRTGPSALAICGPSIKNPGYIQVALPKTAQPASHRGGLSMLRQSTRRIYRSALGVLGLTMVAGAFGLGVVVAQQQMPTTKVTP